MEHGKDAKAHTSEEETSGNKKLKRKDYERELEKLHVELVKLQEWVATRARRSASI